LLFAFACLVYTSVLRSGIDLDKLQRFERIIQLYITEQKKRDDADALRPKLRDVNEDDPDYIPDDVVHLGPIDVKPEDKAGQPRMLTSANGLGSLDIDT